MYSCDLCGAEVPEDCICTKCQKEAYEKQAKSFHDAIGGWRKANEEKDAIIKALKGVKDAAQILFDVANIQNWREDRQCPHGNSTYFPVHGWWCDECWFALGNALKKLEEENG